MRFAGSIRIASRSTRASSSPWGKARKMSASRWLAADARKGDKTEANQRDYSETRDEAKAQEALAASTLGAKGEPLSKRVQQETGSCSK